MKSSFTVGNILNEVILLQNYSFNIPAQKPQRIVRIANLICAIMASLWSHLQIIARLRRDSWGLWLSKHISFSDCLSIWGSPGGLQPWRNSHKISLKCWSESPQGFLISEFILGGFKTFCGELTDWWFVCHKILLKHWTERNMYDH